MLESASNLKTDPEFVEPIRSYIANILHQPVALRHWDGESGLPTFLSKRYDLLAGTIFDHPCLLAVDGETAAPTPLEVTKHLARMGDSFSGIVIYVAQYLASDRRSRLIAANVPFIIPGNQLYIPQLAVDLREHFRARPKRNSEQLSPVAQAVLFYNILFHYNMRIDTANRTPTKLSRLIYYSVMSVGRAFEELASVELATVTKHGRTKQIHFASDGRSLISLARPLLREPVKSRKYMRGRPIVPPMKVAGESALANTTGISPPQLPVYAMHRDDWPSDALADQLTIVDNEYQADAVIEFWHYRPQVLSDYAVVDPLSLYAQFWDDPNERIAKAADDTLGHVSW